MEQSLAFLQVRNLLLLAHAEVRLETISERQGRVNSE